MSDDLPVPAGELGEELALVELVNRVLDKGAVIAGEVVISVAGVDLVHLGLNLYLASAQTVRRTGLRPAAAPGIRRPEEDEETPGELQEP